MGFFDFLAELESYADNPASISRMNARHGFLIEPLRNDIKDARVFDIASHDGRWAYAFADAGAKHVVGVEARQTLIDRFDSFPDEHLRQKVELRCNDLFDELDSEARKGETYDVVSVFGIFYHIMDHFRLLKAVHALRPKVIVLDSEFVDISNPVIQLVRENTGKDLNAVAQIEGQEMAVVGYPSFRALEVMADAIGYQVEWYDWNALPKDQRTGVQDYYRSTGIRRGTCVMWPRN